MEKVLLIGMGSTSLSALESLVEIFEVVGVVRNLGESGEADAVAIRATELGIPIFEDVSPANLEKLVRRLLPACVVVSSYNRIIRPETLCLSLFVNVHYAPLPQYRGRANVNWAIINGEPETAISIHTIVPGLDAGNILFQQRIPIREQDTVADLYYALNAIQRKRLASTVQRFLNGFIGEPQDETLATYSCTRLPEDGEIDWQATTIQISRLVRSLVEPYPGAYTYLNGQRMIIWKVSPLETSPHYIGRVPGRVIGVKRLDGYIDVLTGDGVIRVFEIQLDDSEKTSAADVIRSTSTTLGLRETDVFGRLQALELQVNQLLKRASHNSTRLF